MSQRGPNGRHHSITSSARAEHAQRHLGRTATPRGIIEPNEVV
ncbi:MAG: hypothetical protein ACJ8EL_07655 [Rhizomicrobium sp.]